MNLRFISLLFDLTKVVFSASRFAGSWKISTGIALAIALMGGYAYYSSHGNASLQRAATPKPVPQTLADAVNEACQAIPIRLPRPNRALRPTLLLPLNDDREGLFTERLRTALDQQGWYRPVEASLLDKTLDTVREVTGIGIDPSARSMQWTAAELAAMMRSAKAEAALRGSVNRLSIPASGPVEISLQLELWELPPTESATATLISSLNVERPLPNSAVDEVQTSRWSKLRFYGAAFCVALVWPFAMIPWMRRAIRQDSNAANLMFAETSGK